MSSESKYFEVLRNLVATDFGDTRTIYNSLMERYTQTHIFVQLGFGGYENDMGYYAGRSLVDHIHYICEYEEWLVGDSGANRLLYDRSMKLGLMNRPQGQPPGVILHHLRGTHTQRLFLEISMDDLVLTPMSVFCAELAQKVEEERHVRLMFFCGLVHEGEDKTLKGSTIIRALIYQIIQQNMGFFTAREVDSMYGDFKSILESQNLSSTDLCVIFSGLVRLAERSLNQRKKKMICIIDGLGACNNQRYRGVMEVVQALAEINKTVPLFQLICTGPLLLGVPLESFARVYGLARSETDVGPQGSTA